jgi:hypothetical protein
MQQVVMVVPVNPYVNEAENVTQKNRKELAQGFQVITMRHLQFQDHDRDDDGEHAIAKRG